MGDEIPKIFGSTVIILSSAAVLYQSCSRASTIYFFELDSVWVFFIERHHALLLPFLLSLILWLVYLGTKRNTKIREEKKQLIEKEKLLRSRTGSMSVSRKVSRTGDSTRKTSFSEDNNTVEQARRLSHLLSDIEEQDTVHSQGYVPNDSSDEEDEEGNCDRSETNLSKTRFTVGKVDEPKFIVPDVGLAHTMNEAARERSRRSSTSDDGTYGEDEPCPGDIYRQFSEMDLLSYIMSALNIKMASDGDTHVAFRVGWLDVVADFFAIHVPVWMCVAALYAILRELTFYNLDEMYYYYSSYLNYACLFVAILLGIVHEFMGNWITNDILAFASIYIISSRFQAVSYQTSVVFVGGMIMFDLFWLYVCDLLSTVTLESRAPLMILFPRDWEGNKQSLATLDIMVPGVFLNVVLKYSSMYDSGLFIITFYAVIIALFAALCSIKYSINVFRYMEKGLVCMSLWIHKTEIEKVIMRPVLNWVDKITLEEDSDTGSNFLLKRQGLAQMYAEKYKH